MTAFCTFPYCETNQQTMRNLLVMALLLATTAVSAQKKHKHHKQEEANVLPPPRVWVANIPDYTTTYEMVMANPTLITDSVGCKVSGFTISLAAPGQPFYGPLHCVGNTMNDMQKGALERWKDIPNITMHIQDIHLNCHETDATSPALRYYYNVDNEQQTK